MHICKKRMSVFPKYSVKIEEKKKMGGGGEKTEVVLKVCLILPFDVTL